MQHNKANSITLRQSMVVLGSMIQKNIKTQYRRSVLGVLWTVLNPFLTMLVMAFVFSKIFGRNMSSLDYPVYVMSGNIVFGFLRTATSTALTALVQNRDLLQKTRVPAWVFPSSNVFSALANFGFSYVALIIVMLVRLSKGVQFHWEMLMVVAWLPAMVAFCLGLGLLLSVIYVRFRDIKHLYTVFLLLWTYATPVFYSLEVLDLEDKYLTVMKCNPMYHYLDYFRSLLCGVIPGWKTHLICYGCGFAALLIGGLIFLWQRKKIVLHF